MNLNSNRPPQTKLVVGTWTALWVIVSIAMSLTLWAMQFSQPTAFSDGMKAQSVLLTGGNDEVVN